MILLASLAYAVGILFCLAVALTILWVLWSIFKPKKEMRR